MTREIEVGRVIREFYVGNSQDVVQFHDEIMDALMGEDNAKECTSGHNGFLLTISDDARTDAEIITSLQRRLAEIPEATHD